MRPSRTRRPRLTYANVASTLALVLALSMGGAYAHGKIGSALIKDNAVKSRHIANGNVKTADLRSNAVTSGKIKGKSVKTTHIRDHAVWALVSSNGELIQGHGVEDVDRSGTGFYGVRFNKAVTNRALTATLYYDGLNGHVAVAHCDEDHPVGVNCFSNGPTFDDSPKAVRVNTESADGTNADRVFLVQAMPRTPTVFTTPRRVTPRGGPCSDLN